MSVILKNFMVNIDRFMELLFQNKMYIDHWFWDTVYISTLYFFNINFLQAVKNIFNMLF